MSATMRAVTLSCESANAGLLDRPSHTIGAGRSSGRNSRTTRCRAVQPAPKGRPSRDMTGPFEIQWIGSAVIGGVTVFSFRVKGSDGQHVMHRRYNDFVELSHGLETTMVAGLPDLPPKSFFRRLCLPSFQTDREEGLGNLLRAAVEFEPEVTTVELRKFLGLSTGSQTSLEAIYSIPESTGGSSLMGSSLAAPRC